MVMICQFGKVVSLEGLNPAHEVEASKNWIKKKLCVQKNNLGPKAFWLRNCRSKKYFGSLKL